MKKSVILILCFMSFRANASSCLDLVKLLLKPIHSSREFEVPSQKLLAITNRELKNRASKLGLNRKEIKDLTFKQKKQLLALTGVSVFLLPKRASAESKVKVRNIPVDKAALSVFRQSVSLKLPLVESLRLSSESKNSIEVLKKLKKAFKLQVAKGDDFNLIRSLSQDRGKNVYNPTIWDFLSMDLSTPLFTFTKEVFKRAIANTRFEQTIDEKVGALEQSFKKHLSKWISKLPSAIGEDRRLKLLVTRLYLANESCKAINMIDLYKKVMADLDKLIKASPDPKAFLEKYSKKSKDDLRESLKESFLNAKTFLKENLKKTADLVDKSFKVLSGGHVDCIPSEISSEAVNARLKEAQKIKDGINSLASLGTGKHVRDIRGELKNEGSCSKLAKDQIKSNMEKAIKAALSSQLSLAD